MKWAKPKRADWMDQETYASLPDTLEVREVRVVLDNPSYRSKEILIATTLLDAQVYRKSDIADLDHERWHVELFLRRQLRTSLPNTLSIFSHPRSGMATL